MAKLYSNENVPMPTVEALRQLGHDVLTALDAGVANTRYPDNEALALALSGQRIFITNDRADFRLLHAQGQNHCGIVEFKNDANFAALAGRISNAVNDPRAVGRFYASVTQGGHTFR